MGNTSILVGVLDEEAIGRWLCSESSTDLLKLRDSLQKGIFNIDIAHMFNKYILIDKDRQLCRDVITSMQNNVDIHSLAMPPQITLKSAALAVTGLKDGEGEDEKPPLMIYEIYICAANNMLTEVFNKYIDINNVKTCRYNMLSYKNPDNSYKDMSTMYIDDIEAILSNLDTILTIKGVTICRTIDQDDETYKITRDYPLRDDVVCIKAVKNADEYLSVNQMGYNLTCNPSTNGLYLANKVDVPWDYKFSSKKECGLTGYEDLTTTPYTPILTTARAGSNFTAAFILSSQARFEMFMNNISKVLNSVSYTKPYSDMMKLANEFKTVLPTSDTILEMDSFKEVVSESGGFVIHSGWHPDRDYGLTDKILIPNIRGKIYATDAYTAFVDYLENDRKLSSKLSSLNEHFLFKLGIELLAHSDFNSYTQYEQLEDTLKDAILAAGDKHSPYFLGGNVVGIVGIPIYVFMCHPSLLTYDNKKITVDEETLMNAKHRCYVVSNLIIRNKLILKYIISNELRMSIAGQLTPGVYDLPRQDEQSGEGLLSVSDMLKFRKKTFEYFARHKPLTGDTQFRTDMIERVSSGYDIVAGAMVSDRHSDSMKKGSTKYDSIGDNSLLIHVKSADGSKWEPRQYNRIISRSFNLVPSTMQSINSNIFSEDMKYINPQPESEENGEEVGVFTLMKMTRMSMLRKEDSVLARALNYIPLWISNKLMSYVSEYFLHSYRVIGKYSIEDISKYITVLQDISVTMNILNVCSNFSIDKLAEVLAQMAPLDDRMNNVVNKCTSLLELSGAELIIKAYLFAMCSECSGEPLEDKAPSQMNLILYNIILKLITSRVGKGKEDGVSDAAIRIACMAIAYRLTREIKNNLI